MSDLAKVGFSVPANRCATTPDTQNTPLCPETDGQTYAVTPRPLLDGHNPNDGIPLRITRAMFNDPANFSYEAVGVYVRLIANPVGTRFTLDQIAAMSPADPVQVAAEALTELVAAGYVEAQA